MSDESLETVVQTEQWYHKITVEPPMFLFMMSCMLTSVVEQVFFLYKACTVNHGYPPEVCIAIQHHEDIEQDVQITASTFHMWNNVAMFVFPVILALFMGAWSDRRGRKLPLILGLVGKLLYSAMLVVNSRMDSWPVQYIIYTATIPSVLTGADVAVFGACYAYISDVTSTADRTSRIALLEVAYLSTMPIGVIVGRYIYSRVDKSFTIMFTINVVLLLSSIIYSALFLKSHTTDRQVSILELRWYQMPGDLFDRSHIERSLETFSRKRSLNRRTYLYALMAAVSFYNFQRDEKSFMYLYTLLKFGWDEDRYSYFRTYQTAMYVVLLFLGMPLCTKVLRLRDTIMVMFGAMTHAVARLVFVSAQVDYMMYVGATVSSLGPFTAPVLRSMISKMFPVAERGIIFSFLSVFDNATTLISGVLYTEVYNASIGSYPQAFLWVTIATQLTVLILTIGVHVSLRGKTFEESTTEVDALLGGDQHSTGEPDGCRTAERT
ncbi:proton-coupled folate transporter-like [Toxorhynchites rutilus septentrionalis]|uniref:proton-coupled folate transporter-like n=1 Tax=Toxorhynchites rutilus septentrionalis TaxID=329112 RepID=UPI00247A6EC6|nr:proton-coupled folate transporter-like [Toxorhynchites rutilus septentrionalis]